MNINNTSTNKYSTIIWKHNIILGGERFNISGGAINKLTSPDTFKEVSETIDLIIIKYDNEDHRITYKTTPGWENNLIHAEIKNTPSVGKSLLIQNEREGFKLRI